MKRVVLAMALVVLAGCDELKKKQEEPEQKTIKVYAAFGLSDIPTRGDGCELFSDYATITQKQYEPGGQYISILEFRGKGGDTFAASMSYDGLGGADSRSLTPVIQVGDQVFVRYSACGSSGHSTVTDLIKRW